MRSRSDHAEGGLFTQSKGLDTIQAEIESWDEEKGAVRRERGRGVCDVVKEMNTLLSALVRVRVYEVSDGVERGGVRGGAGMVIAGRARWIHCI